MKSEKFLANIEEIMSRFEGKEVEVIMEDSIIFRSGGKRIILDAEQMIYTSTEENLGVQGTEGEQLKEGETSGT